MTTAAKAVELIIARVQLLDGPRETRSVLTEVLTQESGNGDAAAEEADRLLADVTARLRALEDKGLNEGASYNFTFCSVGSHLIQGAGYPDPGIEKSLVEARIMRAAIPQWRAHIANMSPRDFEHLCRGVLATIGCQSPRVTTRSSDQGIDFYGRLSLERRLDNFTKFASIDSRLSVWFAGQAKHRPGTRVSTEEVRHIVGSVAMARSGVLARGGETLDGFRPRFVDPVVVAIITSGEFSRDTVQLIERSGVLAMDGAQLAAFLCDNKVGLGEDGAFSLRSAAEWLREHRSP